MPATSKAQQELMGADLARARAGQPTRTGMSQQQLADFATTPRKGLPERKGPSTRLRQAMKKHQTSRNRPLASRGGLLTPSTPAGPASEYPGED